MEAKEFRERAYKAVAILSDRDGPDANCGVGFFVGDIEELIEEWNSENHEYTMDLKR